MAYLVDRLRAMSRNEHDDLSIGDEAADEIERLRAEVADHKAAFNKLNEMLAESLEDRDRLRAEIAALKRALVTDWDGKSTLRMLTAERDALKKDAERYRWLRDAHPATEEIVVVRWRNLNEEMRYEKLDSAIDAALSKEKP